MIAGKQFTTLRNIERMRELCRAHAKGARSLARARRKRRGGQTLRRAAWVIRDGKNKIRTGRARADRQGAEQALAEYIAQKYQSHETADVILLKS